MLLGIPVRDVDSMDCVLKTWAKSKNSRGHLCYTTARNMSMTFLCPQVPSEAEKQRTYNTQTSTWLLVASLSLLNSKNWEEKAGQEILKSLQFG